MLELPENIEYIETRVARYGFIIRKMCEYYKKGTVIDIGCGNGSIAKMLGKLGADILGIDLDEHEIKNASESNPYENVRFACLNVNEISERKFSGVVLTEVLEHIENPLDFLQTIYELCESDGFLILTVPNGYSIKEIITRIIHRSSTHILPIAKFVKWYRKITRRDLSMNESQHVQWFTLQRIRELIQEAGFTIQEEYYCDIWSELLWVCIPWIKVPFFIKRFERIITPYMPHYFLEDWEFFCLKKVP